MHATPGQHHFDASELRLNYYQWGDTGAPVVLLVHATGFHARCWDRVVAALPDGYRVLAPDLRGHGLSERRSPFDRWNRFGQDVLEFVQGLGISDAIGVGHSMGGHCVVQAAAQAPGAFRRLVLIDPVILDPDIYSMRRDAAIAVAEDHPVARRRNRWASWQEMFERFREREPFSRWDARVLEDYCRYGVVPSADGDGFELACPPLVEASIYLGNTDTDIYHLVPQVDVPVLVMRARARDSGDREVMDFSLSPTWEGLAGRFPHGRDLYLPHLTHFIPMQDPALVARHIVDPSTAGQS